MNLNIIIHFLLLLPLISATEVPVIPNDTGRTCPPGEIENGNTCVPCPDGTFRPNSTSNPLFCTPCPIGFVSTRLTPGLPGSNFYLPRDDCEACTRSFFQDIPGQTTCKRCPPNTIYSEDFPVPNTNCTQCPPDKFIQSSARNRTCETCPAGSFLSTNADGRRECNSCPFGTFTDDKPGSTACQACPPGTITVSKTGPCIACKPGYFSTPGAGSCTACTAGFYQPSSNSSSCLPCPAGSTSGSAAAFCTSTAPARSCPPGSFLTPAGTCEQCGPGTVSPGGAVLSCSQCTPPSFADPTGARCRCRKGFAVIGNDQYKQACVACPLRSITDGITCKCPAPLYLDTRRGVPFAEESACACPPGKRYDGNGCVPCEAGAVPGEGDCDFCGPRAAVDPNTGRCVFCDRRRAGPTFDGTCKCPEGYFFFPRAFNCFCRRGFFEGKKPADEIPEECRPCPDGTVAFRGRCSNRCNLDQPRPFFRFWDGEKCVRCPSGLQAVNGRCIPQFCEAGFRLNEEKGVCECNQKTLPDGSCQNCPFGDGFQFDREKNECVCQEGLVLKDGACMPCPAGFTTVNGGECTPCPGKRYKPEGERTCFYCAEASADVLGATACVKAKCRDDEFETQDGSCLKCNVGQRVKNGVCVDCGAGEVSAGGRLGYCSTCVPGSVPNADRSGCVPS